MLPLTPKSNPVFASLSSKHARQKVSPEEIVSLTVYTICPFLVWFCFWSVELESRQH